MRKAKALPSIILQSWSSAIQEQLPGSGATHGLTHPIMGGGQHIFSLKKGEAPELISNSLFIIPEVLG